MALFVYYTTDSPDIERKENCEGLYSIIISWINPALVQILVGLCHMLLKRLTASAT